MAETEESMPFSFIHQRQNYKIMEGNIDGLNVI